MSDDVITINVIFTAIFVCFVVFGSLGFVAGTHAMFKQAIEHNAEHYDPKTSEFTWNN